MSQLSSRLLDELPTGFRVFITLDADLMDTGVLPYEAAEVLNAPGAVVPLGLITGAERERLAAEPAYAEIVAAHEGERTLMGRLMVSFDRAAEALQIPDEDAVRRVAVLRSAVDRQRAAVPLPLTREVIKKLYRVGYWYELAGREPQSAVSRSGFRHALKVLLAPAPGRGLRLLDEVYSGQERHLRPHPLLTVLADSPQRPPGWAISETLWNHLANTLDDAGRLSVGLTTCTRGDYRHARRLMDTLDPATIPAEIVIRIAIAAHESGEIPAARDWYGKAVNAGHAYWAPAAMVNLAMLEREQGRVEDARDWYRMAVGTGDADLAPSAMFNLATLEAQEGYIQEARDWYLKAIESGHADEAPSAMVNLGLLEQQLGRLDEASARYAQIIEIGHREGTLRAQEQLDRLRRHWDDMQRVENFAKYGHPFIDADHDQPPAMADRPCNAEEKPS